MNVEQELLNHYPAAYAAYRYAKQFEGHSFDCSTQRTSPTFHLTKEHKYVVQYIYALARVLATIPHHNTYRSGQLYWTLWYKRSIASRFGIIP